MDRHCVDTLLQGELLTCMVKLDGEVYLLLCEQGPILQVITHEAGH